MLRTCSISLAPVVAVTHSSFSRTFCFYVTCIEATCLRPPGSGSLCLKQVLHACELPASVTLAVSALGIIYPHTCLPAYPSRSTILQFPIRCNLSKAASAHRSLNISHISAPDPALITPYRKSEVLVPLRNKSPASKPTSILPVACRLSILFIFISHRESYLFMVDSRSGNLHLDPGVFRSW